MRRFRGQGPKRCGARCRAGQGLSVGGAIACGHDLEVGKGILVGADIRCDGHIEAGWGIKARDGIEAGGAIKAGESLYCEGEIRAGKGYGVYAGLIVPVDAWEASAQVRASIKPERLMSGWWLEVATCQAA